MVSGRHGLLAIALTALTFAVGNAEAGSVWTGTINCSYGSGSLNIKIDDNGQVSGGMTNGKIRSGKLSGSTITFPYSNMFGNGGIFSGSVFGNTMGGIYSQSVGTEKTCRWQASLSGSAPSATPKKNARSKAEEREIEEAKGLVERAKIVQRQPGCESQKQAAGLLADASVIYRRLGMPGNSDKINAAADKLTGEGGTYYQCLAKRSNRRDSARKANKNPQPKQEQKTSGKKSPTIRECLRAKLKLEELQSGSKGIAGIDAIIENAENELRSKGCKI